MAYENCASADACDLGPSMADICSATTSFLTFMSLIDTEAFNDDEVSGLSQRIDPVNETCEYYDFIIVGGGAAGSVVASRLSENTDWTTLVLERGHDQPVAASIFAFETKWLHTAIDWNYTTTGEPNACLSTNGSCYWPAGKTLGGSLVISGGAYLRGTPADYNAWEDDYGCEGWGWDDVYEYFLLSEDNQETDRVGTAYHATDGLLPVSRLPYQDPRGAAFLDAAEEEGYIISEDFNGEDRTGFSEIQFMSKDGIKITAGPGFLWPAKDRDNLDLSLNSFVTKILIEDGAAIGVQYHKDDQYYTAYANKEVVVSAGVMRSPQLLMLSGIGPQEDLENLGIEVIKDSPGVGENLQNHVSYFVPYVSNRPDVYDNDEDAVNQYFNNNHTGPLSGLGVSTTIGVLASTYGSDELPDLLVYPAAALPGCATGEVGGLQSSGNKTLFMIVTNTRTQSRGKVTLASTDPLAKPLLRANYFNKSQDIDVLVEGIEKAMALVKADALADYGFTLSTTTQSACSAYEYPSTEYWACAVKQNTVPENHQGGSCKMGVETDSAAVVDLELRVHGIDSLRVIDASVMPVLTSAPPGPGTIMIAERGAQMIKETWE